MHLVVHLTDGQHVNLCLFEANFSHRLPMHMQLSVHMCHMSTLRPCKGAAADCGRVQ